MNNKKISTTFNDYLEKGPIKRGIRNKRRFTCGRYTYTVYIIKKGYGSIRPLAKSRRTYLIMSLLSTCEKESLSRDRLIEPTKNSFLLTAKRQTYILEFCIKSARCKPILEKRGKMLDINLYIWKNTISFKNGHTAG